MSEIYREIVYAGFNVLSYGLPALFIFPIFRVYKKVLVAVRYLIGVFVTWVLMNVYNDLLYLPARLASATERGNLDYDGVGLNVGILFFGWIIPAFMGLIYLAILGVFCAVKLRKNGDKRL